MKEFSLPMVVFTFCFILYTINNQKSARNINGNYQFQNDNPIEKRFEDYKKKSNHFVTAFINRTDSFNDSQIGTKISIVLFNKLRCDLIEDQFTDIETGCGLYLLNGMPLTFKKEIIDRDSINEFFIGSAFLYQDTLNVGTGMPFNNYSMNFKFSENKFFFEFEEFYKRDNILRLKQSDPFTNSLFIPTENVEIKLNSNDFQNEDVIYGYGKFTSSPFYRKDFNLNNEELLFQWTAEFVMKINVICF